MKTIETNEFRARVAEILTDFDIDTKESDCVFGTKKIEPKTYRDIKQNLINASSGIRHIFISSRMYPDTDKDFRYGIIYTMAKVRNYRCKNWFDVELDKVYISDADDSVFLEKIKAEFK